MSEGVSVRVGGGRGQRGSDPQLSGVPVKRMLYNKQRKPER